VKPPEAKRIDARREHHGDVFIDPYEWLRDKTNPEVIDYLKAEKIPYRVSDAGGNIEVASGRLYETRMALAGRGVPQGGGVGFEIFDKQTLGMTDFVQRLNYQRALQGELARSIAELDTVESARVHLAMPERSLFVSEERRPSASVVLKLRSGRTLAPEQVAGVVHLVSASVEGLRASDVTVVDVNGQVLTHDQAEQDTRNPGKGMMTFQRDPLGALAARDAEAAQPLDTSWSVEFRIIPDHSLGIELRKLGPDETILLYEPID